MKKKQPLKKRPLTIHRSARSDMLLKVLVVAVVAAVGYAALSAGHAASGLTGICVTPASRNLCMRVMPSGQTYMWPRDISGDVRQQFTVTYQGTASSLGCGEGYGIPNGTGVYTFKSKYNGDYIGAGKNSGGVFWLGDQFNNDPSAQWAWFSSGMLKNCGDTDRSFDLIGIPAGIPSGHQLYTNAMINGQTWQQVHP